MTITREDLDSRCIDFSDIASGRRLPPDRTVRRRIEQEVAPRSAA